MTPSDGSRARIFRGLRLAASSQSSVLGPVDDAFVGTLLDGRSASTPYVIELRHLDGDLRATPTLTTRSVSAMAT